MERRSIDERDVARRELPGALRRGCVRRDVSLGDERAFRLTGRARREEKDERRAEIAGDTAAWRKVEQRIRLERDRLGDEATITALRLFVVDEDHFRLGDREDGFELAIGEAHV